MGFDLLPILLRGVTLTVQLTLTSAVLALIIAIVAGLGRLSPFGPVRALAGVYVEVFRGTSVLVQMFWLFFALPLFGLTLTPFVAGVAALALNMPPALRMRRVVLPQALVLMMPPFGNLLIELLKATALVSLITLPDVTYRGVTLQQTTGQTAQIFTWLLIIYFVLAYPLTLFVRWIERRASAFRGA